VHIRVVRTKRGGKVHEYPQLVESYRRADGMPATRVIASLKDLSSIEVDNLRTALRAGRGGQRVVAQTIGKMRFVRPTQNLRYLDLAVLLELWRRWGLDSILADLMHNEADVAPADVVTALVLQRCVAPGSKLFAERWFPTTALPELLALPPAKFNNTRLHRVLERLDRVTPTLMERLSARCLQRGAAFASLFIDVTDTWFTGEGPQLAQRAKTKEGLFARKVGIVLLCNEHGYPLRWQVVAGRSADNKVMHSTVAQLRKVRWAQKTPVVLDRAMGSSADLAILYASQLHFLTAIRKTEYSTYAPALPWKPLSSLNPSLHPDSSADEDLSDEAGRRVEAAGMRLLHDELFTLDLGVRQPHEPGVATQPDSQQRPGRLAHVMWLAHEVRRLVEQGDHSSYNAAARSLGIGAGAAKGYRRLLGLTDSIQRDILEGKAESLSLQRLYRLAKLPDETEQREKFDRLLRSVPPRDAAPPRPAAETFEAVQMSEMQLRVVAYFNPVLFVEKRRAAEQRRTRVEAFVAELNRSSHARRSKDVQRVVRRVEARLRKDHLLEVYDVHIDTSDDDNKRVELRLDEDAWARRRRYDGFSVLVGHPDLSPSAAELVHLYRAKDRIEKDFQVIKSVVKLRPVHHCTDAKVRAHVTLCMLALLLERAAVHELAARSLTELVASFATCHLNRYETPQPQDSRYLLTRPTAEQRRRLDAMRMGHLAEDEVIVERIVPR
jgi:transposase